MALLERVQASVRRYPWAWAAGGAVAVGAGLLALRRRPAADQGAIVVPAAPPQETAAAPPGGGAELAGLISSLAAQQSEQTGLLVSQLAEQARQQREQDVQAWSTLLAAMQEQQEEAARQQAEFYAGLQEQFRDVIEAQRREFQRATEAISERIESRRPREPDRETYVPVPYGPTFGYGGFVVDTPQEQRYYERLQERLRTEPGFRESEIARAQAVIENRRRAGLPTQEQEEYLRSLREMGPS